MNEHFKFYAKLSGLSALRWVAVFIPGLLLTLIFSLITGFQNADIMGSGGGGHAGIAVVYVWIAALFMENPCAFVILIGSPFFLTFYFIIANKAAIQTLVYGIWTNKASHHVEPRVKSIVDHYASKSDQTQQVLNKAKLRAGLLDASRKDPNTSGVQKRVITYAFKKIQLNDLELNNDDLTMGDVISVRVSGYISESSKPGFLLFWILLALQTGFFIGSQVLN